MAVRAALFDLDGTLADTAPDLALALNLVRAERGLEPVAVEITRPYTSGGARGLLKIGFNLDPADADYAGLKDRFLAFYEDNLCVHTRLFEGMPQLLDELERRKIRWGVVTNKAGRYTAPLMAKLGLAQRAACVVSGDTAARPKPHPDSLLYAAAAMHLAPGDCLYVGDDLRDVQAARAAGMGVLAAAYGYLGVDGDPHAWGADAVIDAPLEVLNLLHTIDSRKE